MWKREHDKSIFDLVYPNHTNGKLVLENGVETDAIGGEYIIEQGRAFRGI